MKIKDLIGQYIVLENQRYHDTENGFSFCFTGTLEWSDEYPNEYYVRVKEDGYGVSGMNFLTHQISSIEKQPSGRISIVLK